MGKIKETCIPDSTLYLTVFFTKCAFLPACHSGTSSGRMRGLPVPYLPAILLFPFVKPSHADAGAGKQPHQDNSKIRPIHL